MIKIMDCKRCGHQWATKRADSVRVCPKCKSPWFDKDKRQIKLQGNKRADVSMIDQVTSSRDDRPGDQDKNKIVLQANRA